MKDLTVGDLMTRDPTTLSPRHKLRTAADELRLGRIHHLPIVDKDDHVLGLLTQRDLLVHGDDLDRLIGDVMHTDVTTVQPDSPAYEAAYLLLRHAIGCVPVVDANERLVGIVTDTDFVRIAYAALGGTVPVDQLEAEEREADNV